MKRFILLILLIVLGCEAYSQLVPIGRLKVKSIQETGSSAKAAPGYIDVLYYPSMELTMLKLAYLNLDPDYLTVETVTLKEKRGDTKVYSLKCLDAVDRIYLYNLHYKGNKLYQVTFTKLNPNRLVYIR